jgi:hypothetical protein
VIDTQGLKYNENILDGYDKGLFISATKIYSKKSLVETRQLNISQFKNNLIVTENDFQQKKLMLVFFFTILASVLVWIYLNLFRLISALWWTLWFWVLGTIMKVENITFSKVYFSVLNFYIIPLSISLILFFVIANIPFFTFGVLSILFVLNYMKLNRKTNVDEKIEGEINIENK